MKSKTKIGAIATTVVTAFIMVFMVVQSFASDSKYLNVIGAREGNETYQITDTDPHKTIWKIVSYDSMNDEDTAKYDEAIYCINPEIGFGSATTAGNDRKEYNASFNMKNLTNVEQKYKDMFATMYGSTYNAKYNSILWIIDNMYLPKQTPEADKEANKNALFTAAGINRDVLTDNDIEVVQQMAIWYFSSENPDYHYELNGDEDVLPAIKLNDTSIDEIGQPASREGEHRLSDMNKLYRYLVSSAKDNQAGYGTSDVRGLKVPVITFATPEDNTITSIETIDSVEYFVAGPYKFNETNHTQLPYTIEGEITDQSGNDITNYKLLDATKNDIGSTDIDNTLVGQDFYIAVPTSDTVVSKIKLKIKLNYFSTTATVWTHSDNYATEQPVVIVEKQPEEIEIYKEVTVKRPIFDLSLRKFITEINGVAVDPNRDPNNESNNIDVTKLKDGTETTATYTHPKNPLSVKVGDLITYTIRVYNEGELKGYAKEITDHLPEGLKFVNGNQINTEYGWSFVENDTKTIATSYLAWRADEDEEDSKIINPFDKETGTLYYQDVKVVLEVVEPTNPDELIVNIAEITDDSGENGVDATDRDSQPEGEGLADLENYELRDDNSTYQQDDDDYEPVRLARFDLSLRKFITKVGTKNITSREPRVTNLDKLISGESTTATYTHDKTPLVVKNGDLVTYTIRIYNEGNVDGAATEITDYVPEGLEFVPATESTTNRTYGWTLSGNKVTTSYLADKTISAFDKTAQNPELDYEDVKIEFKVIESNRSDRVLRNIAEITADDNNDIDSVPDNVDLDSYNPPADNSEYQEDDDDYEQLKLQYFDLALRKFITKVGDKVITSRVPSPTAESLKNLADGTVETATYVHPKTVVGVKTGDTVQYTIRVYNEGNVNGTATEISDYVPEGLEFIPASESETNRTYGWVLTDNKVTTDYLANKTITAFDKANKTLHYEDVVIEFKVIEPATSDRVLRNIAEITADNNDDDDSVPDNVDLDNYNPGDDNSTYQEDDDDYEVINLNYFDLSLRKFITNVAGTEITNREPVVSNLDKLIDGSSTTATYTHPKAPISVRTGDKVIYTIRVYNEGKVDGTATEITDYVPEGLEYIPASESETNKTYEWVISGNKVTTEYLADKTIPAFDKTAENPELKYEDVKIEFKVVEPNASDRILRNIAEITEDDNNDYDSTPGNVDLDNYNPTVDNSTYQEDDDDYEQLKLENFDLSLRKFITNIDGKEITSRIPNPTIESLTALAQGTATTATYVHPKDPILVKSGDKVVYTIRVYNEGKIDGFATEITDYVPEGLKFAQNSNINNLYNWVVSADGKIVKTDYLKDTRIKAFDKTAEELKLDYKDVQIEFEVIEPNNSTRVLRNIAEITDDSDDDTDSTPKNVDLDNYNPPADNSTYQEDDDDYEQIKLVEGHFDLSLRKFITKVNSDDVDTRYPVVALDEDGNLSYTHTKEPVLVSNNNIVIYTIRVYNEGTIAGYAKEVSDDIPNGLSYLPEHEINKKYEWKLSEDGKTVSTDYLSKEKSDERQEDNLLKAFDKDSEIAENNPDFRDVQIAFKVTETNLSSDRIIINTAEITDDSDENGNDVVDEDSTPGNENPDEDDIDKEYLKVRYFDLSLLKWVSKTYVTENGKTTVHETGHTGLENPEPVVKVDLDRKNLSKVAVKFGYTIKVTNEGEIAGYAKEVSDYIPEGLKFVKEDNPDWEEKDGKIVTRKLENTLLQPGESATVEVVLTWINNGDNMGLKVNVAEISEDYNEDGSKDIDSTPDNKKDGEDDIDDAPVILTIKTGIEQSYIVLSLVILVALSTGIALIKKYVLDK